MAAGGSASSPSSTASDRSANASGGFLYSEYLQQDGDSEVRGSFVVRGGRSAWEDAAKRTADAAIQQAHDLPVRAWALGSMLDESDSAGILRLEARNAGWALAETAASEALLAAAEGGIAGAAGLRGAGVELTPDLGGRRANVAVHVIGELHERRSGSAAWQARGFASQETKGVNVGALFREDLGNYMLGLNAFADFERDDDGAFWRMSGGGEFRSAWADAFFNYYRPLTGPLQTDPNGADPGSAAYTAEGYDFEVRLHAPKSSLEAAAALYRFTGEYGNEREAGLRYAIRYSPRSFLPGFPMPPESSMRWEAEYDDSAREGEKEFGWRLSYAHSFGNAFLRSAAVGGDLFNARDYFFTPAQREYTQRIRRGVNNPPVWRIVGARADGDGILGRIESAGVGTLTVVWSDGGASVDGERVAFDGVEIGRQAGAYTVIVHRDAALVLAYGGGTVELVAGATDGTMRVAGDANRIDVMAGLLIVSSRDGRLAATAGDFALTIGSASSVEVSLTGARVLRGVARGAPCVGAGSPVQTSNADRVVCQHDAYFVRDGAAVTRVEVMFPSADVTVASLTVEHGSAPAAALESPDQTAISVQDGNDGAVIVLSGAEPGIYAITAIVADARFSGIMAELAVEVLPSPGLPLRAGFTDGLANGATVTAAIDRSDGEPPAITLATVRYSGGVSVVSVSVISASGLEYDEATGIISVPAASLAQSHTLAADYTIVLRFSDPAYPDFAPLSPPVLVTLHAQVGEQGSPISVGFAGGAVNGARLRVELPSVSSTIAIVATTLEYSGGGGALAVSVAESDGLEYDAESGEIWLSSAVVQSGIATLASIKIAVSDSYNGGATWSPVTATLFVQAAPIAPVLASLRNLQNGATLVVTIGGPSAQAGATLATVDFSGGAELTSSLVAGDLAYNPDTRLIRIGANITAAGAYSAVVSVYDAGTGASASANLTLHVEAVENVGQAPGGFFDPADAMETLTDPAGSETFANFAPVARPSAHFWNGS